MACEQVDDVVSRAVHRLGHVRHLAMEISPLSAQEARVCDVLHERVMEGQRLLPVGGDAIEEAASEEDFELTGRVEILTHRAQERDANDPADHRCRLQEIGGGSRQEVDPRRQQTLDGRGDLSLLPAGNERPVALLGDEDVLVAEGADQLTHEEGVARCALEHPGHESGWGGRIQRGTYELGDTGLVERLDAEDARVEVELDQRLLRLGPPGQVEDDRRVLGPSELGGELEARRIRPVHILQRQDDAAVCGEGPEPRREGVVEPTAKRVGLERSDALVEDRESEQAREVRHPGGVTDGATERLGRGVLLWLPLDARGRPQELRVGPVGEPDAVGEASGLEPDEICFLGLARGPPRSVGSSRRPAPR